MPDYNLLISDNRLGIPDFNDFDLTCEGISQFESFALLFDMALIGSPPGCSDFLNFAYLQGALCNSGTIMTTITSTTTTTTTAITTSTAQAGTVYINFNFIHG